MTQFSFVIERRKEGSSQGNTTQFVTQCCFVTVPTVWPQKRI